MTRKILFSGAAVVVALSALYLIPQVQPAWLKWWPVYSSITANAATTFSGILGPLISIGTLAVVYFTLREQGRTNVLQRQQLVRQRNDFKRQQREFKTTINRQENESFFDLTFRIVERFTEAVERQQNLFTDVPEIGLSRRLRVRVTGAGVMGELKLAREDEWFGYQRQFFVLTQFFAVISRRIEGVALLEGEGLKGAQKLVLLDLLDIGYGVRLNRAIADYQRLFGFEAIEQNQDEMYPQFWGQVNRLSELREAAESQAGLERIPFGDAEA